MAKFVDVKDTHESNPELAVFPAVVLGRAGNADCYDVTAFPRVGAEVKRIRNVPVVDSDAPAPDGSRYIILRPKEKAAGKKTAE